MMSYTKEYRKFIALLCALFMLAPVVVLAADLNFPVACYQGADLAKVREWEKTFVGKKITAANVDQVKEFLPESFYNLMKDTKRWGDWWFTIVPYQQIPLSPGKIEATKKYFGQPRINEQGDLNNWTAGEPFPGTSSAIEMAYNYRTRNYGDTLKTNEKGYIVDGRMKYDMSVEIHNNYCFFSGRVDAPPVPEFPNNPKQIWRAFTMEQLQPPEVRNMRIMEIHYKDFSKPYDSWFWMPSIRRIRRRSTTERQDAQGGGDFCGYDNMGWDGPVHINSYKSLGEKDVLLVRHSDNKKLEHTEGNNIYNGTTRERIKVKIIEAVNKDSNFLYSKMIWYLDPETWQILYSDRYDRKGNLWKVMDQFCYVAQGYNNVPVDWFNGSQMIDVQRRHSTMATASYIFGIEFDPNIFTLDYLQKHGY